AEAHHWVTDFFFNLLRELNADDTRDADLWNPVLAAGNGPRIDHRAALIAAGEVLFFVEEIGRQDVRLLAEVLQRELHEGVHERHGELVFANAGGAVAHQL